MNNFIAYWGASYIILRRQTARQETLNKSLRWRHNEHDSVSNHQPHGCLLNRLFRHRSKKTSKLRVTGLCVGNSPGPVNSPHKGPVTRKMFPFDDVIMINGGFVVYRNVRLAGRSRAPALSCHGYSIIDQKGVLVDFSGATFHFYRRDSDIKT